MKNYKCDGLNEIAKNITDWRDGKRFITPNSIEDEENRTRMNEKLMLVVTEIAEAAEAVRHNDYENFKEEIADTFIRLLDICGACSIDIAEEIEQKMFKNEKRPEKHGKLC